MAGLVVVLVAVGAVLASRGGSRSAGAPASTRPVDATPRTTPTAPGTPLRGLAVTESQLALVDTSRPVVSGGDTLATERHLTTDVWTPAGPGPYPLVVFAPGYDKGPSDFTRFCSTLASSGYVVAAPSFPLEDPAQGFDLDRGDLPDEAGDVSFVITSLEGQHGPTALAPGKVAVVGHSDGADVALLVAYGPGTADPRVTAVVAVAPDPMAADTAPSSVPLLLVQGTMDSIVPYTASQTVFGQVDAPVTYLSLVGADHLPPIIGGTPWTPVLDAAVAEFLDATVADRGPGPGALAGELSGSPLVTLRTKT